MPPMHVFDACCGIDRTESTGRLNVRQGRACSQKKGPRVRGPFSSCYYPPRPECFSSHSSIDGKRSWRIIMRYLMFATTDLATRREPGAMYFCEKSSIFWI